MKKKNLPLQRLLTLGIALGAPACGGEDSDLGGSRGRLEAEQGECVDEPAELVAATHTVSLWPPNHKLHSISVSDCVTATNVCATEVTGEFIWASSDEPVNANGDGNHEPDIQLDDSGNVCLRSERQGPKNGRVYKLGVRVEAGGQSSEAVCTVIVDHDQRGVEGQDDGESYRVTFDGLEGATDCDGVPAEPPPAGDGDGDGGDGDGDGEEPPVEEPPVEEPPVEEPPVEEPPVEDPEDPVLIPD
jgi:hypothetical protein